jgi:hypothetical protein
VAIAYVQVDPSVGALNQTSLVLWLKSDVGVQTGSGNAITKWTDMSSGSLSATQTNAASQPTLLSSDANGYPALHFDSASAQFLNLPSISIGTSGVTLFAVFKTESETPVNSRIIELSEGVDNNNLAISLPGTNNFEFVANNSMTKQSISPPLTSISPSVYQEVDASILTGSGQYRLNSNGAARIVPANLNPLAFSSHTQNFVGSGKTKGYPYFNGSIVEILCFSTVVTPSDRAAITAYLIQKYGIGKTDSALQFSPSSGTIFSAPSQVIVIAPVEATTYWSVDQPATTDSQVYQGPIPVAFSQTIHVLVVQGSKSSTGSASYVLDPILWPKPGCN